MTLTEANLLEVVSLTLVDKHKIRWHLHRHFLYPTMMSVMIIFTFIGKWIGRISHQNGGVETYSASVTDKLAFLM